MRSAPPVPVRLLAGLILVLSAAACFGGRSSSAGTPISEEERARRSAMLILEGSELESAVRSGATIVQILSTRVPSLRRVQENGLGGSCPIFVLRGNSSITQVTEPDYYVDGSRANDSCVMLTIPASELRAIEVYASAAPLGMATRAKTGGAIVFRTRIR